MKKNQVKIPQSKNEVDMWELIEAEEKYLPEEITLIEYENNNNMLERVSEWITENYKEYDPKAGERLEITIVIKVSK